MRIDDAFLLTKDRVFFLRFFWLMVLNRLTAERNVNITDILCAKVKIINCVKIRNLNFFLKIIVGISR